MGQRVDLSMVEFSPDFISGYDEKLNVVVWNPAIAKKYKMPREEVLGKNLFELFPYVKKDDFRIDCMRHAIKERQTYFFSMLPYAYEKGTCTQLIMPTTIHLGSIALNIVRDHKGNERYQKRDLLECITE
jgi:PAS domain-containing protein